MRLLDRKTITQNINAERKADIDEGIKLARKVDALRETLQKEEQNALKYKSATLDEIQKQIEEKMKNRDYLKKENLEREVAKLEEKREKLLIPLDKEYAKLEERTEGIKKLETEVNLMKEKEEKITKEIEKKLKNIEKDEKILNEKLSTVEKRLTESEAIQEEAKKIHDKKVQEERDIMTLEAKRAKLVEPLDKEWENLKTQKIEVDIEKKNVRKLNEDLEMLKIKAEEKLENAEEEEKNATDLRLLAQEEAERATGLFMQVENTLTELKEKEIEIDTKIKEEKALISASMVNIDIKQKELLEKEEEITKEKIRLADMRATLEHELAKHK